MRFTKDWTWLPIQSCAVSHGQQSLSPSVTSWFTAIGSLFSSILRHSWSNLVFRISFFFFKAAQREYTLEHLRVCQVGCMAVELLDLELALRSVTFLHRRMDAANFFYSFFRLCALLFLIPLSWNCSCHCFLHCCCYTSRLTLFSTHPNINICACVYVSVWVCACVLLCLDSIFYEMSLCVCDSQRVAITPNLNKTQNPDQSLWHT